MTTLITESYSYEYNDKPSSSTIYRPDGKEILFESEGVDAATHHKIVAAIRRAEEVAAYEAKQESINAIERTLAKQSLGR